MDKLETNDKYYKIHNTTLKRKKLELPDEFVDFLSNEVEVKKIPVRDAIIAWKRKQEAGKFLKVGDIVKIDRRDPSDYNGKKAFIGAVLHPVGTGFDIEKSGKFSTYYLEPWDRHIQGDFLGFELQPTGKSITEEFLVEYLQHPLLRDSMHEELQQAMSEF